MKTLIRRAILIKSFLNLEFTPICILNSNPLNLVERQSVVQAIVKLRGASAFMRGDLRRFLYRPAVPQILGDASGSKGVATNLVGESGVANSSFYHS